MIEFEIEFTRENWFEQKKATWPEVLDELVPYGLYYNFDDLYETVTIRCPMKIITNMHPNDFAFSIEFFDGQELLFVLSDCIVNMMPAAEEV